MTIGQFAQVSGLTAKALRFYDEQGVLTPAEVDPASGYRRYRTDQVRPAAVVKVLRDAGLPLAGVRAALAAPERAVELLDAHAAELVAEHARRLTAVRRATTALHGYADLPPVARRRAAAQAWVGVVAPEEVAGAADEDLDAATAAADDLFARLATALAERGCGPAGGWWSTQAGPDDAGSAGDAAPRLLLCWPVTRLPEDLHLPGAELVSGVLPERTEAFVRTTQDDEAPVGAPVPGLVALLEHVGEDLGGVDGELRQVGVLAADGQVVGVELVATTAVLPAGVQASTVRTT